MKAPAIMAMAGAFAYPGPDMSRHPDVGKSHMVDSVGGVWERPFKIRPDRASQGFDRVTPQRERCAHAL
jgi:hypothetical protein